LSRPQESGTHANILNSGLCGSIVSNALISSDLISLSHHYRFLQSPPESN
jgi:hypothetical protein